MIRRCLRYIRGYVRLEVQGAALERFLNICRMQEASLWAIERPAPDRLTACMAARDWAVIEPRAERTMCTVRVTGRSGLGLALRPFARRPALLTAGLIALVLCLLSGQFLWRVTIDGCIQTSQLEIWNQLRGLGLETGRPLAAIDGESIRRRLMTLRDDLSYVTINLQGTEAHVTVIEKDMSRQIAPEGVPCDIVSDKAGVIEEIRVLSGVQTVQAGDTVIPGDRLAEGTIISSQGEERLTEAAAEVTLRTWRTVEVALSSEIFGYAETGRAVSRWSLGIGSRRFELPCIEKCDYAWYYKTMETTAVSLGEGYFFPLTLRREIWHECMADPLALSEEACGEILRDRCRAILQADGAEILKETAFDLTFGPEGIVGRLQAECRESAGVIQPIVNPTGDS